MDYRRLILPAGDGSLSDPELKALISALEDILGVPTSSVEPGPAEDN